MKKGLLMTAFALAALVSCNNGGNSSSGSTNSASSSNQITPSVSTNSTADKPSSSSPSVEVTNISEEALDSLKGSLKLTGSYKLDAVKYGSDYDYVLEAIEIYNGDEFYSYQTMGGEVVSELNLFNDDGFASSRTLTEMNVISEELLTDANGEYYLWEESFINNLSSLEVTDFELQKDGKYLCTDVEAGIEIGKFLIGSEEKMSKLTLVVKDDKVVKIDFLTERYMIKGVLYQDSGSFVVSDHGTAEVPTITPRETTVEHTVLAAALEEINLNYTAEVDVEITPYGYETSTGRYTYYFADDRVFVDNDGSEADSFGYYFDAGTLYEFGIKDGESYFLSVTPNSFLDLTVVAHNLSSFAPEMFTYLGEGVYVVEDSYAPIIGKLVSIDNYGEYSNRVSIKLDENNKLESIQYDFFVDGYDGGVGFYKYTFKEVGTTELPISLDGLFNDIEIIRNIPNGIKGKWNVDIDGTNTIVRISKTSVYFGTTQAKLVSCDGEKLVVELNDETYEINFVNNGTAYELSIVKGEKTYEVTKVDDSMWKYKEIADYVGSDVVPAFTSGTDYNFALAPLDDGSYVYAIEVSGPDASTEWEEEYFIDLATAGFYQDTSYDYDEGYGYIFVASDSSCIVQFYYYPEANVFRIYIYA